MAAPGPPTPPGPAESSGRPPGEAEAARTGRVRRLLDAMRSVGTGLDLDATLRRICETAVELATARTATLLVDETTGTTGAGTHIPRATAHRTPREPATGPEPAADVLEVPVRVAGEPYGRLRLERRGGGGAFGPEDVHLMRVLAAEAGIAIGNARLYEAARRRERWIDGSAAVSTALLSGGDTDEALQTVAEQARRLSGSAAGLVLLPTAGVGLEVAAVSSQRPSRMLGAVIGPHSALAAQLLAGNAVFIEDAAEDPALATGPGAGLAAGFGPVMLLPLHSDGRVLGVLMTPRWTGSPPFTEAERTLAARFAAQAALALVLAEAQRDRERLAVFEDRDRIARDLHDLVIQRLFATGMMLEDAQRGSRIPQVREGVGKAVAELDVTIQEIRTAVFALQPEQSEEPAGLRARVLREITMAAVPLGFTPAHRFRGPLRSVGEPTRKNLVAALREMLSNAFRHAHASRIEVTVDADAVLADGRPGVRLTVADDGVGMPDSGRRSGLRNLERRAESLGGESGHGPGLGPNGTGTTVTWQAPY
ncbi:GAF domain-containing sensor histidine kinase [Streptomyces sp. NPDC058045]|uniref:sensor histidine kinase n=1 Tax=Streptomyces sp. NPDC058045 TaxID=3346311 RepID=UPI0036EBEFD0